MGRIGRLILAAQDAGDLAGQTAQHHALGIHDVPFALYIGGLCHVGIQVGILLQGVVSFAAFDGQQTHAGSNSIPGLAESIEANEYFTKFRTGCQ